MYHEMRSDKREFFNTVEWMNSSTFDYISKAIYPYVKKTITTGIGFWKLEERLFLTLRYLSTGISFRQLSFSMQISKSSISTIVKEVCEIIWQVLQPKHMPIPPEDYLREKAKEFYTKWNFPNCIGSIDGKHIRIKCIANSSGQYYNYKQYYSIVLQAVVDANLKFLTVDVGAYNKQSDGGVFRYSSLYCNLETGHLKLPLASVLPN